MIIDGDDALDNNPHIFDFYNNFYQDTGAEFTYGSCWSEADQIPLIAQPYPPEIKESGEYRSYKFNWGIPYTHLRTFKKHLINAVQDRVFQHDGSWMKAGGDVGLFYELIENADPTKIHAISEITYIYNDLNPLNDYKVNSKEQTQNADRATNKMNSTNEQTVLIAIPTDKNVYPETFKSIYDLEIPQGINTTFQYFYGYQIDQVRNLMAEWGKSFDYTLWVDSDIVLPKDALVKLLSHQKDFVSGLYRRKIDDTLELYYDSNGGQKNYHPYEVVNSGLINVSGCGFGCVLTSRNLLNSMEYPHFVYHSALTMKETVSEDISFCNKAKELGYSIYADTSLFCGHIGTNNFNLDEFQIREQATDNKIGGNYKELPTKLERIEYLYNDYPNTCIPKGHMEALKNATPTLLDVSKEFIVYDIGSELLYWSREFSEMFPNAKIYHFEGNSELEKLYYKVGLENYHMGILAGEEKAVNLDINNETGSLSIFEENKSFGQEAWTTFSKGTSTANTLSKAVLENNYRLPDFIKLDIQGAELEVMRGSEEIIKEAKVVVVELQHTDYLIGAPLKEEIIEYMGSIGFENLGEFYRNGFDGDYLFVNNNK